MIEAQERARRMSAPVGESDVALAVLAEEMGTYRDHLPELLQRQEGRYVLVKGTDVAGIFGDRSAALREGYRRFGIVPFLVRQVAASEPVVYLPNVAPWADAASGDADRP